MQSWQKISRWEMLRVMSVAECLAVVAADDAKFSGRVRSCLTQYTSVERVAVRVKGGGEVGRARQEKFRAGVLGWQAGEWHVEV